MNIIYDNQGSLWHEKKFQNGPRVPDKGETPVLSPTERMFLRNLKIAGESYSSICIKFTEKVLVLWLKKKSMWTSIEIAITYRIGII